MYHCRLSVLLAGAPCEVFEVIKAQPPLDGFTHIFSQSPDFQPRQTARGGLAVVNLQGLDAPSVLASLRETPRKNAQFILLAEPGQVPFGALDPSSTEVWTLPLTPEETSFRFARWQDGCKQRMDRWEMEHFLDSTINSVPSMVWFKDKEGIHKKVNDSFCRMVNKPKSAVEGRDHCFIWGVGPEDALVCAQSDADVMESRSTFVTEEQVESALGTRYLTTYKSPLYDWDGSVMGTVGIGLDITQERTYQENLLRRTNVLETLFTSLECGVLCHSLDGLRILNVNKAALDILGYRDQEELVTAGFHMVADSVLDEDKPSLRASILSLRHEGDSISTGYRVLHRDGSLIYVMGNAKLIRENGELCYQRFLLDITAQKLREQENNRHQAALIQALSVDYSLVCFFDLDTGTGMALRMEGDPAVNGLFSGEPTLEESMGQYIETFVDPLDQEDLRRSLDPERLRQEFSQRQTISVNYRRVRDGQPEYWQMKLVRSGRWGQLHGLVLGCCSVDEETRREQETRRALEDAMAQATRASRAKSAFLSNMSHDIRTPMNAVIGFTNLAITHLDNRSQVRSYLDKILASGRHMIQLINDVLDMSRIESGKTRLEEAPCDLAAFVENTAGLVRENVTAKGLRLLVDVGQLPEGRVMFDALRLGQILLNLLSNAVKFTPEGGDVSLRVTQRPGVAAGQVQCLFSVADTGIGMSPEFIERIFEPFERERNTTISGIQGTGLGMAITKNLVDMMGGTIEIKSSLGEGSEFLVDIPLRLADGEDALPERPAPPRRTVNNVRQTGNILLVEDNLLNSEIAQAFLEDAGFTVTAAFNGKEALDLLCGSPVGHFQAVLMDVQMPVMDGYAATRAIRALPNEALAAIPILAMTANAFDKDKRDALDAGMNDHISKPIDAENLLSALSRLLP